MHKNSSRACAGYKNIDLAAILSELDARLREQLCDPLDNGLELIAMPVIESLFLPSIRKYRTS
ncbi:MAG: hypothetical protein WCG61_05240 [Chlorobium sp.]